MPVSRQVPLQIERGLELLATDGTGHLLRIVYESHVLSKVAQVAVDPAAHVAWSGVQRVKSALGERAAVATGAGPRC